MVAISQRQRHIQQREGREGELSNSIVSVGALVSQPNYCSIQVIGPFLVQLETIGSEIRPHTGCSNARATRFCAGSIMIGGWFTLADRLKSRRAAAFAKWSFQSYHPLHALGLDHWLSYLAGGFSYLPTAQATFFSESQGHHLNTRLITFEDK